MKKKYIVLSSLAAILVIYLAYRGLFVHQRVTVTTVQRGNLVTVVYAT